MFCFLNELEPFLYAFSIPLQQTSLAKHTILTDCFFGDIFNGRILDPLPPTCEFALIPWLSPHLSSLLFLPLCSHETNKEQCRTKSLQTPLKGMPLFLIYFCFYSLPLSRSLPVAYADYHIDTLA